MSHKGSIDVEVKKIEVACEVGWIYSDQISVFTVDTIQQDNQDQLEDLMCQQALRFLLCI